MLQNNAFMFMVMRGVLSLTASPEPLDLGGDKCYLVIFRHLADAKRAISDITLWPEPWKVESGD